MQTTSSILEHVHPVADHYVRQSRLFVPLTTDSLARAGIQPGMRVLDVGCGTGDVSFLAADIVGLAGSVFGTDRASHLVAGARRRAEQLDRRNVRFDVCDTHEVPPPHEFDAVIASFTLCETDAVATLSNLTTYLRSGGVLVLHESGAA